MKLSTLLRHSLLVVTGLALMVGSPLRAGDEAHQAAEQVHDLLKQALGGDSGTAPANPQRADLLKQAGELLKTFPHGKYGGHLTRAKTLIESALDKVNQGDAGDTAKEDIRDADSEVRSLE